MTDDAIREAAVRLCKAAKRIAITAPRPWIDGAITYAAWEAAHVELDAAITAYEAAQAKVAAPAGGEPSAEALMLAHDTLHPEDGGDHRPVKLLSARSSADTVSLAKQIDAIAARRVAEALAAERAKPDASDLERARRVVHDLTGHDPGETSAWGDVVAAALAEAVAQEREHCAKALPSEYKFSGYPDLQRMSENACAVFRDYIRNSP